MFYIKSKLFVALNWNGKYTSDPQVDHWNKQERKHKSLITPIHHYYSQGV
jgi:hypothetical protein